MNICVTGGAGFIGSHIVDRLIENGYNVLVIDNLSTGSLEFVNPEATFIEMDIRDASLKDIFVEHKIEYVFHEAAQTLVPASIANPKLDCDVNLNGLINVLEACRHSGVKKILTPSSAAVYGDVALDMLPLTEEMIGVPTSFYGLTKLTMEGYLRLYESIFRMPYICYRYSNVYGPRQGNGGEGGVISIFAEDIINHKTLSVFGDGEQTRDFVYVDDVVDANMQGLQAGDEVTGIFNVSTNIETSINELIDAFKLVTGEEFDVAYLPARVGDVKNSRLCNEKSKDILNFEGKTNLTTGLLKTYHYFRNKTNKL